MNVDAAPRPERWFEATAATPRAAREFVAQELAAQGAPPLVVADFRLIVSELVANAVQHGRPPVVVAVGADDPTRFEVHVSGGMLPDEISDPRRWTITGPDAPSGRGLGIVRDRVDEVAVARNADGSHVVTCRCRRRR
jgi:anti-sigma regulatory factor (Ser/Thr protein kinase)